MNNILVPEEIYIKEELQDEDCIDHEVLVCNSFNIGGNTELNDHERQQYETSPSEHNIKTELSSAEVSDNKIDDHIVIEEFGNHSETSVSEYNIKTELSSSSSSEVSDDKIDDHIAIEELSNQSETCISEDNIKTELSSVVYDDKIDDHIAIGEFGNELLFCEHCHVYYEDYCIKCGMLVHILNKSTMDNANKRTCEEMPIDILDIQHLFGRYRIITLKVIPKGVKFGPFTGLGNSERIWRLKGGKFIVSEERLKFLNWMQYINPAKSISEQNLLPFYREDSLYYRSTREIQEGEELQVYFGEEYEDSLNKNIEMDFVPIPEEDAQDVFACTLCCLGFSSREYLARHKSVCYEEISQKFSIEQITRCPFCKIHLDEKEFFWNHMDYCHDKNARSDTSPLTVESCRAARDRSENITDCSSQTLDPLSCRNNEPSCSFPKPVKRMLYLGDVNIDEDFLTTERARKSFKIAQKTVNDMKRKIKTLNQSNRRLHRKINNLQPLLERLKSKDMITEEAYEILQKEIKKLQTYA